MAKTTIKSSELLTGRPLAWNIFDADGTLMYAKGLTVDPDIKTRILKRGLLREVGVENSEMIASRIETVAAEQSKEVHLPFSETGVRPGDIVHLIRDMDGSRLLSRLVGYMKSKSVIITVPADEQGSIFLKVGEAIAVKVFSGKHILSFSCSVIAVAASPFPHIHLSYPADVTGIVVRRSERVPVRIIAAIDMDSGQASGIIADLSTGGMSLATRSRNLEVGARATINFKIEVAGCTYIMKPACQVKAIRGNSSDLLEGAMVYGLQFCDLPAEDVLILGHLVAERLAETRSTG